MNNKEYLFYIEPYVYVSYKDSSILLYNTLNKRILEYNDSRLSKMISNSKVNAIPYSIRVSQKEMKKSYLLSFINETRNLLMSNLIKLDKTNLPISFYPIINFQKEKQRIDERLYSTIGDGITYNLIELTLYINGIYSACDSRFKKAYKQFIAPAILKHNDSLNIEDIKNIFHHNTLNNLTNINIIYNFRESIDINKLTNIIDSSSCRITFHTYYLDIINSVNQIPANTSLNLYIDFPLNLEIFKRITTQYNKNVIYTFIIENSNDLQNVNRLIENESIKNYDIKPYYNENNFDFFKDNVFINLEDILDLNLNIKEILTNSIINKNEFGRITILNNGNIFSNTNKKSIGNIRNSNFKEILLKEINSTQSWRRLRNRAKPCKNCNYNLLCPPLSNYELVFNRNNLCNIVD